MLRREPTKITLTTEDIVNYDTHKAQKDMQRRQQEARAAQAPYLEKGAVFTGASQPDTRTREQRIGLGGPHG